MEIDFEVMSVVAERLEAEISKGALNATVTIGTGKCGNVFRLQVLSPEDAEEEDVADVPEWAKCIATSNAKSEPTSAALSREVGSTDGLCCSAPTKGDE